MDANKRIRPCAEFHEALDEELDAVVVKSKCERQQEELQKMINHTTELFTKSRKRNDELQMQDVAVEIQRLRSTLLREETKVAILRVQMETLRNECCRELGKSLSKCCRHGRNVCGKSPATAGKEKHGDERADESNDESTIRFRRSDLQLVLSLAWAFGLYFVLIITGLL